MCLRLRQYLEKHDISPNRFSKMLGMGSPTPVYRYVHGNGIPSFDNQCQIEEITNGYVRPIDWVEEARRQKAERDATPRPAA